jgi:hypothetical protein
MLQDDVFSKEDAASFEEEVLKAKRDFGYSPAQVLVEIDNRIVDEWKKRIAQRLKDQGRRVIAGSE